MRAELSWRRPFSTRRKSFGVSRRLLGISIGGCLVWNCGCTVNGFQRIPDGPTMPGQLRAGAAVARAEADALDEIADQQEGVIRDVFASVQSAAGSGGLGPIGGMLLGGGMGWLVPTPGQKRREKVAAAEAKTEAKT